MTDKPLTNPTDTATAKAPLWTKNFVLATTINLFIFLSFQMFPPTLPLYIKELGASDATVGWIGGSIVIATLLMRPFAGLALDGLGRKKVFILGLCVVLLMTIAYGLFPIVAVILAIRFIHGLGWGMASTGSTTVAADFIPKKRFGEGMAYFSLSASLAMAIAPALALSIGMHRTVIVASVFTAIATALAFVIKYRQIPAPQLNAPKKKFAPYEKAALWPGFIMFLINASYGALISFVAIYALSHNIPNIGVFFTVYAVSILITRPFFGKLIDAKGFNAALLPGVIAAILSMVILSMAYNITMFLISGFLYGIAFGACQTSLQTMAVLNSPPERIGAANATFFTGFDGGIGFGSILAGVLATWFSYGTMFLLIALLPFMAMILHFMKPKPNKKEKP